MNNYDYPIGADNSSAPWHQEESKDVEVEVLISLTLSKSVKINISDSEAKDLIGCNFRKAVDEQIILPHMAGDILKDINEQDSIKNHVIKSVAEDLSGWYVDEYEVVLNKY